MPKAAGKREKPIKRRIPRDARRERILTTASIEFAARGYDGLKTQDLAKSCDISEALIYQHFDTKADLYMAVMERASDALQEKLAEASAPGPPVAERLERGLDAFIAFIADGSNAWPTLTQQASDLEIVEYQGELRARAVQTLAELLALDPRASKAGLKRRQLEQLAEIIAGGAEALAAWWRNNPKAKRSELVDLLTAFVWSGFERMVKG
ncbi:MAG: TetR/AcrR family transcriptional regulator [Solirubrobacterales bacterium]